MKTPFTYLIGWSKLNLWYYGVRYAKGCSPNDLFTTYFTSSKYVHATILQHGQPDVIEVRRTFKTVKPALQWEQCVQRRLKMHESIKWLNKNVTGDVYYDKEVRQKIRDAKLGLKAVNKHGKHIMVTEAIVSEYLSQGWKKGHGRDMKGKNGPTWGYKHTDKAKKKISLASSNRVTSEETKEKLRITSTKNNGMRTVQGLLNHMKAMNKKRFKVYDGQRIHKSIAAAARHHSIPKWKVQYRCDGRSKKIKWSYLNSSSTLSL